MELSHSLDDGLTSFFVTRESERGILLRKANKCIGHFLLISLRFGFDGNLDHRLRELHLLKNDGVVLITKSFSGGSVLESNQGNDIPSNCRLNFSSIVGVHL